MKRIFGALFAALLFSTQAFAQTPPVPLGQSGGVGVGGGGGSGTVSSVSTSGGILSVANPTTTPAISPAGTSGGIPCFNSATTWTSSAALPALAILVGGGAGACPSSTTTGANVLTALSAAINASTGLPNINGAIVTGDCLKWGPGVQDAGATCGGTPSTSINAQTGTTYTVLASDVTKLVTFANASAIAVTLPAPTGSFAAGFCWNPQNKGPGTVTITPASSTINGASTLALTTNQGVAVCSDGANWQIGNGGISSGGAVSSVSNADGTLTISPTTGAVVGSIALAHANTWTATTGIGIQATGRAAFNLENGPNGGSTVPVPTLYPATNNTNIALDLSPHGVPTDLGYGVAWNDLCTTDQIQFGGSATACLHISAGLNPSRLDISSAEYTAGTLLPLYFGTFNGDTPAYTDTFVINTDATFQELNGVSKQIRTVTAAGAVTVAKTDHVICVNKTVGAATTANLFASPRTGANIIIKDCKGDAATNNITVTPAAGLIDASGTFPINSNYGSWEGVYNGVGWSTVPNVSGAGGGGIAPNLQTFTTPGAATYTPTAGMKTVLVIAFGCGGGGGGGALQAASTAVSGGGAGGGGGMASGWFTAAAIGASKAISVCTAGTAGVAATTSTTAGGNGGQGGNTTFGGTMLTAFGGGGGAGGQLAAASGGGGGAGWNGAGVNSTGATGGAAGGTGGGTGGSGSAAGSSVTLPNGGSGGGGSGNTGTPGIGAVAIGGGTGGGGGGGITAANVAVAGSNAFGNVGSGQSSGNASAGAVNGNGGNGTAATTSTTLQAGGGGAGGGGAGISGTAGNGGTGGLCGGGSGGGGSMTNGGTAGTGGTGGGGCVYVLEY